MVNYSMLGGFTVIQLVKRNQKNMIDTLIRQWLMEQQLQYGTQLPVKSQRAIA
jgi:hypothetical protein